MEASHSEPSAEVGASGTRPDEVQYIDTNDLEPAADGPPAKRQCVPTRSVDRGPDTPAEGPASNNLNTKRGLGRPPKKARTGGRPKKQPADSEGEGAVAPPAQRGRGRPSSRAASTDVDGSYPTSAATPALVENAPLGPILGSAAVSDENAPTQARVSAPPALTAITEVDEDASSNYRAMSGQSSVDHDDTYTNTHNDSEHLNDVLESPPRPPTHTGNKEYCWLARSSEQAAFAPVTIPPYTNYKEFRDIIMKEFDVRPSRASNIKLTYRTGTNATKANSQLMRLDSDIDFIRLLAELGDARKKKKEKHVWIIENAPTNTVGVSMLYDHVFLMMRYCFSQPRRQLSLRKCEKIVMKNSMNTIVPRPMTNKLKRMLRSVSMKEIDHLIVRRATKM